MARVRLQPENAHQRDKNVRTAGNNPYSLCKFEFSESMNKSEIFLAPLTAYAIQGYARFTGIHALQLTTGETP
jgi:hypothetical protein